MKKISLLVVLSLLLFLGGIQGLAKKETYAHYHIVNLDSPLPLESIIERYNSYDMVDGNITAFLKFQSDYEKDYLNKALKVQDYPLHIQIENSRGNQKEWIDMISVRDFTAPIISVKEKDITIDSSKEDIKLRVLEAIEIQDNWDQEFSTFYWTGLEAIKNGEGSYVIGLSVADQSDNISSPVSIPIKIIESIKMRIATTPIHIKDTPLTEDELIRLFLKENSMEQIHYTSIEITSSYFEHTDKNGIYQAKINFLNEKDLISVYQVKIINELKAESKQEYTTQFITLGILGAFILAGILIYRKRS